MSIEIVTDTPDIVVTRHPDAGAGAQLSLLKHIYVEWGEKADWDTLCELHYKGHTLAAGSRYIRCILREPGSAPQLIGIMVFANPRPLDGGRNEVFPRLKPNVGGRDNRMINQARLRWVNKNLTWNNRTVLDTMYRSAGIAYRFKNLAYRMYCSHYGRIAVESRSSMGRFNPFSIKSGMRFTKPKRAAALDTGLKFFSAHFRADPTDIVAVQQELEALPAGERRYIEKRLREFYYKWSSMEKSGDKRDLGMTRVNTLSIDYVLKQVMQLVFSATVYWVWAAQDKPGTLPTVMPLIAFEEQRPEDPLARSWADYVPPWGERVAAPEELEEIDIEAMADELAELENPA
jgi:hypothetical protein